MANLTLKIKKYDDGSESHYDSNCNLIYHKDSNGFEYWKEYDENDNLIHYKNTNGYEYWREYDENNNKIHYKDSKRYESWKEYDKNNNLIHSKDTNGNEDFYINNKKVLKEQWEKYYNSNKIVIQGREYKLSDESIEALKQMLKDLI